MPGATDDGGEDSTRGVISGESGFAHTGSVVNNQCGDFIFHGWTAKGKKKKKMETVNTRSSRASFRRPVNAPRSHFLCNSPRPPLGGARGPTLRTGAEQKGNGAAFYHYHIRTWLVFRAALRLPAPWRSARDKRGAYREQTSLRPRRPLPPGHRTTSSAQLAFSSERLNMPKIISQD